MTKWEYKKSSFFPDEDVLNLWGSQDWEYIAANDAGTCLFKRPAPEKTQKAQETAPKKFRYGSRSIGGILLSECLKCGALLRWENEQPKHDKLHDLAAYAGQSLNEYAQTHGWNDPPKETAPEPEVSVTLTYSDMHFLSVKFSRWVYPYVETAFMPQFSRIEQKLKDALAKDLVQ